MMESNMAAVLESKMAAISGIISTLSWLMGRLGTLSVASKHNYVLGHGKHFPPII